MKQSEIESRADFSTIRYAQCWEDSRLLSQALNPQGKRCLSIGSAGDNSFALLADGAEQVVAVELNATQIACIKLRKAMYLRLEHAQFLELIGSRPSSQRPEHYQKCRELLEEKTRDFWDHHPQWISAGIGSVGKFERYFQIFRQWVLPMAHTKKQVRALLQERNRQEREQFYERVWDNRRWRWIFQLFFSRKIMGALGRDPEFFSYVEGSVARRILERTRHALVTLEPANNPYLHWILTGIHGTTLPEALRAENYTIIRQALQEDRLHIVHDSIEGYLSTTDCDFFSAFNLSDIFEYMSEENMLALMQLMRKSALPGARFAYWNMLAPRTRPQELAGIIEPIKGLGEELLQQDRAFFYQRFVVEEVQ